MAGSGQKRRCLDTSDIADIFSPTFINSTFRFSPMVKYENLAWITKTRDFQTSVFSIFACSQIRKLGSQKSEIFKHPSSRYSHIVKYENLDVSNQRFSNICLFDIHSWSNRKT